MSMILFVPFLLSRQFRLRHGDDSFCKCRESLPRRLPLPWRLRTISGSASRRSTDEVLISEPLPDQATQSVNEADAVCGLPVVEAVYLLVEVAEQMRSEEHT